VNVLIKVSASISVYKICEVVSSLKKFGANVKVCASKSSLHFVGPATWEALTGEKVFVDDFSPSQRMDHIYLNKWADVTVLAPATAKTLCQISNGVGDGVLNTLWLARDVKKPYLIFPAMNPTMWDSSAVRTSMKELTRASGVTLYSPDQGLMACGDVGLGRLKEPDFIINEILKYRFVSNTKKEKSDSNFKRALVTFGGTSESIDGVRELSNFSTGLTGKRLCEELFKSCNVTAFYSQKIDDKISADKKTAFSSSDDLEGKLKNELENMEYDVVFHLAAVSDYKVQKSSDKKMDSSMDEVSLRLVKRDKILPKIKTWSKNKNIKVISFKLTHNQSFDDFKDKILSEFKNKTSDYVVHNSLNSSRDESHRYIVYSENVDNALCEGFTKTDLIKDLESLV